MTEVCKGRKRGKKVGHENVESGNEKRMGSCVGSDREGRVESFGGWLGSGAARLWLAALCFLEQRLSTGAVAPLVPYSLVWVEAGLQSGRGAEQGVRGGAQS